MLTVSSSPLSEPQEEAELELVSMETTDSASWGQRVEKGLGQEEEDEEQDEVDDNEDGELLAWRAMASKGSLVLCWPGSTQPPPIMLFMAFCISRSILCFSLFGIRPKRTAAGKELAERLFRCTTV